MHWMILPLKRYAEFSGRSRRLEYWMFALLNLIVGVVLLGIVFSSGSMNMDSIAANPNDPMAVYGSLFSGVGGILLGLYWLAVLIPSIAVNVRRLHDRNLTGWIYLGVVVLSFVPLLGILVSLGYLVLMLLPGTDGPNKYGPDPKNPAADAAAFE